MTGSKEQAKDGQNTSKTRKNGSRLRKCSSDCIFKDKPKGSCEVGYPPSIYNYGASKTTLCAAQLNLRTPSPRRGECPRCKCEGT